MAIGVASIVAFLIGSIPTGVLLSRTMSGRDVRDFGSGNIGAANVARTSGFGVGALVGLIDILKGVLPVTLALLAGISNPGVAIVAICAVLGHDFSIFLRFRGGKGVATTLGAALAMSPLCGAVAMVVWLCVMLAFRYSSVASLSALAAVPVCFVLGGYSAAYIAAGVVLAALGLVKHRDNIARLAGGTESKFRRNSDRNAG